MLMRFLEECENQQSKLSRSAKTWIINVNTNLIHVLQNESSFEFVKAYNNKDLNLGLNLFPCIEKRDIYRYVDLASASSF